MSQYQAFAKSSPDSALSGATNRQRRAPMPFHSSGQHRGTSRSEEHTERQGDAFDVSQALEDIQKSICQLHAAIQNSQEGMATPDQGDLLGVLTNIANGITVCLDKFRTMNTRDEAITGEPTLHPMPPNIAPVLRSENAMTGDRQTVCPAPEISPFDGTGCVMAAPPIAYVGEPYRAQAEAMQIPHEATGYICHPRPDTSFHAYPYVQPCLAIPPSPELYQTQWVQSPPVSPLTSASFCQHPVRIYSPSTIPDPAMIIPSRQEAVSCHTLEGTSLPANGTPGHQQEQPLFPSPGVGTTMSLPLHYDTPAGTRMAMYRSYLPGQLSEPSARPETRWAPAVAPLTTTAGAGAATAAAPVSELAAQTPLSPRRAPIGLEGRRSPMARRAERFARVETDSDSGDDLDSRPGTERRWADALKRRLSP